MATTWRAYLRSADWRIPLPHWAIAVLGCAYLFILAAALWFNDSTAGKVWADAGVTLSMALFVAASAHAARRGAGYIRVAWILVALGAAGIFVGQVFWDGYVLSGAMPPSPNPNDVGCLVAVPLFIAGFVTLSGQDRLTRVLLALDMVGLAFSLAVLFASIFWPDFQQSPFESSARVTIVLYPIAYTTLAGALWFLPIRDVLAPVSRRLLMAGLLIYIAATVVTCPSVLRAGFTDSIGADVLSMLTGLLVALSALAFRPLAVPRFREQMMGPTAWVTVTSSTAAMGIGFLQFHGRVLTPQMVQVLGILFIGMLVVMAIRLGLTLRYGQQLVREVQRTAQALRESEELFRHQALHDSLTDLPNRTLLRERLAAHTSVRAALLFMDLDRFKEVNDSYGHHVGDALLIEVARRLRSVARDEDTVARLGGDEFAILLSDVDQAGAIESIGHIVAAIERSMEIDGHVLDIGTSIGCALVPDHGSDVSLLMRRADIAMYAAKRAGADHAIYSPSYERNTPERLNLVRDLRHAIDGTGLCLFYQPLLNTQTNRVEIVEALVRWEHPSQGLLTPGQFVPLAEETGLIEPLTRWVLGEALRQHGMWRMAGHDVGIAINLSARNLHSPETAVEIAELLARWDVNPGELTVEITESAIMVDPAGALRTLEHLHALGVHIAIDDFGTGYSSLAHVQKLPVDQIKIDRSFVMAMMSDEGSAAIVRSVLDLGHNLGLRVVAEGVETSETAALLRELGCDLLQGYHICKPAPPGSIATTLPTLNSRLRRLA